MLVPSGLARIVIADALANGRGFYKQNEVPERLDACAY